MIDNVSLTQQQGHWAVERQSHGRTEPVVMAPASNAPVSHPHPTIVAYHDSPTGQGSRRFTMSDYRPSDLLVNFLDGRRIDDSLGDSCVVRLHQHVSHRQLQMKKPYTERVKRVPTHVMDKLRLANETGNLTKLALAYGAGNRSGDIAFTAGQSWLRAEKMRAGWQPRDFANGRQRVAARAQQALANRGGYCDEHAALLACLIMSKPRPYPIGVAPNRARDHSRVLLGDARITSASEIVLGDAYPSFAVSGTLDEASDPGWDTGHTVYFPPNHVVPGFDSSTLMAALGPGATLNGSAFSAFAADLGVPTPLPSSALVRFVIDASRREEDGKPVLWNDHIAVKDPSVRYTDGKKTSTFDRVSLGAIERFHHAHDELAPYRGYLKPRTAS